MSFHFLTFGAGRFEKAVSRIEKQARGVQKEDGESLFKTFTCLTEKDLPSDFWQKHPEHSPSANEKNKRGFGYWVWKPFLILQKLNELKEDEFLVYLDSGFEIFNTPHWRIYLEAIDSNDLVFQNNEGASYNPYEATGSLPWYTVRNWTKGDLFDAYQVSLEGILAKRPMGQAGFQILRNCQRIRDFIQEWYELSCNYHLLSDEPSIAPSFAGFVEHRHDQSTFNFALFAPRRDSGREIRYHAFPNYSQPYNPYQAFFAARNDSDVTFFKDRGD